MEAETEAALFSVDPGWVLIYGMNFLLAIAAIGVGVWAVGRLRAISSLQQRVSDLEARVAQQESAPPHRQ